MKTMSKFLYCWLLIGMLVLIGCDKSDDGVGVKPKEKKPVLTTEETTTLTEAGLDTNYVASMVKAIEENDYPNMHSVLIARDGEQVFERYFPGPDQIWGSSIGTIHHSKGTLHDMRSISKSIVSACIGIAIARGEIESVEQNIFDYFTEHEQYDVGLRSQLTIKHLLSMTDGIEWNENVTYASGENSEIQMTNAPDPVEFVLTRPMEYAPGENWRYSGGTTQLLATIIEKVSGMKVDEYAAEYLFAPLGIDNHDWIYMPGKDIPAAASGLRLTSRDLMKIGMLYYNMGVHEGTRVLEGEWVVDSFADHATRPNGEPYGYQFWILERTMAGKFARIAWASGNGDQCIFIDYENDLVVIITAGNYNTYYSKNSRALLSDFIYPSMK